MEPQNHFGVGMGEMAGRGLHAGFARIHKGGFCASCAHDGVFQTANVRIMLFFRHAKSDHSPPDNKAQIRKYLDARYVLARQCHYEHGKHTDCTPNNEYMPEQPFHMELGTSAVIELCDRHNSKVCGCPPVFIMLCESFIPVFSFYNLPLIPSTRKLSCILSI